LISILRGHTIAVSSVAFSGDGTQTVSGSVDKSVWVWDVSTGVELRSLNGRTILVSSIAISSDGMQIVSGSDDQSVRVWDVSTSGYERYGWYVWIITDSNWIISVQGHDHLMWVPPATGLRQPSNICIISPFGLSTVDLVRRR